MDMPADIASRSASPLALRGERFISLTTFRASGVEVTTPVWFAISEGCIYVFTHANTGKVRRIARNPQITLAPCARDGTIIGPTLVGSARRVTDSAEIKHARSAFRAVYGFAWRRRVIGAQIARIIGGAGQPIFIAIAVLGE